MPAYRLVLCLTLPLVLNACAHTQANSVSLQQDQQSSCPLQLRVGQQLILSLPSNPSTGYRWQLNSDAAELLRSLGPEVYSANESEQIIGSGGTSTWRFSVVNAGSATLHLSYVQPWATGQEPAKTFTCGLNAK